MTTPLSPPSFAGVLPEQMMEAMKNCENGNGDEVLCRFETDFGKLVGSKHVVPLSSATSALHLALLSLEVKKGDIVLCPTFTFAASAFPIVYQDAIPFFVDSELETWNISPDYLSEAIVECLAKGKKPKAIIVVHSYGNPAKLDELLAISQSYDIPIIEDAANALGSIYNDKQVGSWGKIGVFSFNRNKIVSAAGGGCLVTNDSTIAETARYYAHQAKSKTTYYHHEKIGFNYGISPILTEVIRLQLPYLNERIVARNHIATLYEQAFGNGTTYQLECKNAKSNKWLNAMLFESIETRNIIKKISVEIDIEVKNVWKPLHLQPIFNSCLYKGNKESEHFFEKGLCLPFSDKLVDHFSML